MFHKEHHQKNSDEDLIGGFDIPIDGKDRERIDQMVNNYEETILKGLEESYSKTITRPDRIADNVAAFGGSWKFISIMGVILSVWMIWNILPFTPFHFDPGPFILLNLLLSFTAAFQAPIIMMSQNRQAARDKHESIIDFAINYKAEQEIDDIQNHLHRIEKDITEIKILLSKK